MYTDVGYLLKQIKKIRFTSVYSLSNSNWNKNVYHKWSGCFTHVIDLGSANNARGMQIECTVTGGVQIIRILTTWKCNYLGKFIHITRYTGKVAYSTSYFETHKEDKIWMGNHTVSTLKSFLFRIIRRRHNVFHSILPSAHKKRKI